MVERMLAKIRCRIVFGHMPSVFMSEKAIVYAMFFLIRLQEKYCTIGKMLTFVFCGSGESFWHSTRECVRIGD